MEKEIIFRTFKEGDYEMCCDWWDWWWKGEIPVKRELLPEKDRCFIIEIDGVAVAANFLYKDGLCGYLTWMVSNPNYKEKNRRQMIELLITRIEKEAKEKYNLRFLFTVCGNIHTQNIHRKLDWFIEDSAPAYETFKYL